MCIVIKRLVQACMSRINGCSLVSYLIVWLLGFGALAMRGLTFAPTFA